MAKSVKSTTHLPSGGLSGNGLGSNFSTHQLGGDQSYRVPSTSGSLIPANPMKFCLRFKPPTLALVYQLAESKGKKPHKYVKEFRLDLKEITTGPSSLNEHLSNVCDELFEKEPTYFNAQKINKIQVIIQPQQPFLT